MIGATAPAVEKLAVLGDPRPGVHRAGQVIGLAEPLGRVAGQAGRADHGHPGRHVRAQVLAQDGLVERLAAVFGAGMGVRVDQAGDQPALGGRLGAGDRIVGPPVTVGEQINGVAARQGDAANPEDGHHATLTTAAGRGERVERGNGRDAGTGGTRERAGRGNGRDAGTGGTRERAGRGNGWDAGTGGTRERVGRGNGWDAGTGEGREQARGGNGRPGQATTARSAQIKDRCPGGPVPHVPGRIGTTTP
jgi:hypothetical protein